MAHQNSPDNDADLGYLTKEQSEGLRDLWRFFDERNFEIPSEIRHKVFGDLGPNHGRSFARENVVLRHRRRRLSKVRSFRENAVMNSMRQKIAPFNIQNPDFILKIKNGSYKVNEKVTKTKNKINTVGNENLFYKAGKKIHKLVKNAKSNGAPAETTSEKVVIDGVNLAFESGKSYLILGAPGSGKSTLLKMIANKLLRDKDHIVGGEISANGSTPDDSSIDWTKIAAYSDQYDHLHKYLTVEEIVTFAFNCRWGGTHLRTKMTDLTDPELARILEELDATGFLANKILDALSLGECRDTLVGDNSTLRGLSGGERKRLTLAEIIVTGACIYSLDEPSTGLDAATTYELASFFTFGATQYNKISISALVAPPPETVALFDEIIVVDGGRVIYSGDVGDVVQHFESLGYKLPNRMDFVDWLQSLPANDGSKYLANKGSRHLNSSEFAEAFATSEKGKDLSEFVQERTETDQEFIDRSKNRRINTWWDNLKLLFERELLIWRRNNYVIRARLIQNLVMGIIAGSLFWQQHENPQSVAGILFQSMFFITMGATNKIPHQFDVRSILYKQQDAKFFPTWAYVVGKTLALLPSCVIDSCMYGTIVYWFVGLAHNDGASIANYFIYLLLTTASAISTASLLGIFPAVVKNRTTCQALLSLSLVYFVLFSGYTVQLKTLPSYLVWAYWLNPIAWMYRALMINEYQSGKYDDLIEGTSTTEGEAILSLFGMEHNGKAFTFDWVWYALLFKVAVSALSILGSTYLLQAVRHDSVQTSSGKTADVEDIMKIDSDIEQVEIPVQNATLTFKEIHYTVKTSAADEPIELLKGIEGIIESGKMTALMGSSGAGKTTLLDVLALRKTNGTVSGEVRINGHLQEPKSFRRCAGYVEQFDVQSPQLTVRETVEFSAQLRLEESDPNVTPERVANFIDETLVTLELLGIQDCQVGEMTSGGLSFEQLKRLSVAVELVANPSIIFLDEPTTGLDARAASKLIRGLKRIAQSGRAVCATVHQPSVSVFNSFDALLLLKRGGETVFFGDLGHESSSMIEYFERYPGTPKIQHGENPGTWMLNVIGSSPTTAETRLFDYAGSYAFSVLRQDALRKIHESEEEACDSNKISFPSKYATSKKTQRTSVLRRTMKIYWRSPSYNLVRLMVSACVSLIFGSGFVGKTAVTEGDMNSRVTTMFITFLFLSVISINTVLHVFYVERNMFYRHKAAGMYDKNAILLAFSLAEIPFILLSSFIFVVFFYFMMGFEAVAYKFFLYYLFFTTNMIIFTFIGHMLISLLRDPVSAQIFGSLIAVITSLFSGVLIRPQNIRNFWLFAYWTFPGHYILEGLVASQFHNDDTPITPTLGSEFCDFVADESDDAFCTRSNCYECSGTAEDWIAVSFGNEFQYENLGYSIIYLFGAILVIKYITYVALMKLNYLAK